MACEFSCEMCDGCRWTLFSDLAQAQLLQVVPADHGAIHRRYAIDGLETSISSSALQQAQGQLFLVIRSRSQPAAAIEGVTLERAHAQPQQFRQPMVILFQTEIPFLGDLFFSGFPMQPLAGRLDGRLYLPCPAALLARRPVVISEAVQDGPA
jgi:hypothetical protein